MGPYRSQRGWVGSVLLDDRTIEWLGWKNPNSPPTPCRGPAAPHHALGLIRGCGLLQGWDTKKCLCAQPVAPSAPQAAARCDPVRPLQDAELRAALEVLRCYGLHTAVEEWFLEVLQTDLQAHIAPEFWNCVSQYENTAEEQQCSALLLDAFCLLKCRLEPYLSSMELLEGWTEAGLLLGTGAQTLREKVYTMFKAILFFSTTKPFQEMIQQFYSRTFRIYMRQWKKGEEGMNECESSMSEAEQESDTEEGGGESAVCAGCGSRREQCWCPTAMERFRQLNHILYVRHGAAPQAGGPARAAAPGLFVAEKWRSCE